MDKMIQTSSGEVVITNDGATILKHVRYSPSRALVELKYLAGTERDCWHMSRLNRTGLH